MTTVEDGRRDVDEIAVILTEMTAKQREKAKDILIGLSLIPMPKEEKKETS